MAKSKQVKKKAPESKYPVTAYYSLIDSNSELKSSVDEVLPVGEKYVKGKDHQKVISVVHSFALGKRTAVYIEYAESRFLDYPLDELQERTTRLRKQLKKVAKLRDKLSTKKSKKAKYKLEKRRYKEMLPAYKDVKLLYNLRKEVFDLFLVVSKLENLKPVKVNTDEVTFQSYKGTKQ